MISFFKNSAKLIPEITSISAPRISAEMPYIKLDDGSNSSGFFPTRSANSRVVIALSVERRVSISAKRSDVAFPAAESLP